MSTKFRVAAAGAVFLALSLFLYFTVRFKYVERDIIHALIAKTNRIAAQYHAMEKRLADEKKTPASSDLTGFLAAVHKRNPDIALMAITDKELSVRLSSKNERFIRSSELFETILKDFTQDAFNISRDNPYAVRYYDRKSAAGVEQVKFYIFINRAGRYRLLVVYPYLFGGRLLVRTVLEIALIVVFIVVVFAALYIVLTKKPARQAKDERYTIDLCLQDRAASRGDGVASRAASSIAADTLAGYVHELFGKVTRAYGADSLSLYISHQSGRLVKTMELNGGAFLRIDSVSFDTIDTGDEAGRELRNGATMVMEDGRKIIIPLVYNDSFLGCVVMLKRDGLQGSEIRELKTAMAGILKNINDYILVNDVMVDSETGLYSKLYFNLMYEECMKSWRSAGRIFSIMIIGLFDKIEQINNSEKNTVIKLVVPSIADSIKDSGIICRYDSYLAILLNDAGSRKAKGMAREIQGSLARFRIKINPETTLRIAPLAGVASISASGDDRDCLAFAMSQIHAQR